MNEHDFKTLIELLCRYCEEDLDQWDMWKVATKYGAVYIDISSEPANSAPPSAYTLISRAPRERR